MSLSSIWYKYFICLITLVYFRKITIIGKEKIPKNVPILYIGLHKNGAIDGFVYYRTLYPITFMLSNQLRRNFILKLFFCGVEVSRNKDKKKSNNISSLRKSINLIETKQNLFVLPEGTSNLGYKHLEFKQGAAMLISFFNFKKYSNVYVVPCSIFYDDPTRIGGKVDVVVGDILSFTSKIDIEKVHRKFVEALEKVGIDYNDEIEQNVIQKVAVILSLYGNKNYSYFLYKIKQENNLYKKGLELLNALPKHNVFYYKDVAVFPKSVILSLWTFIITVPFVLCAFIWNIIPIIVGFICSKKFADDKNVISLWKIVPGFTIFLLITIFEIVFFTKLTICSLAISLLGFVLLGACKKHFISLLNCIKNPKFTKQFNKLREELYEKCI